MTGASKFASIDVQAWSNTGAFVADTGASKLSGDTTTILTGSITPTTGYLLVTGVGYATFGEDRPLPGRQTRGGSPDRLYLLLDQRRLLRRLLVVRNGVSDIGHVRSGVQRTSPELQAVAGLVFPYQVRRNLHEPSSDAGRAPKLATRLIGPHETVLRQILGGLPVAQRGQDEPEDSRPMQPHQRFEILALIGVYITGNWRQPG